MSHICTPIEIDIIFQHIATLKTIRADYLYWVMSTGSSLQECILNRVNSWLVKWCQWRAQNWWWGPHIAASVRKCLLDIVVKYTGLFWVFVDVIATINLIIPVITLLFPSWCPNCPILLTHHTSTLAQNWCFPRCHQNFSKSGIIWFALLDM